MQQANTVRIMELPLQKERENRLDVSPDLTFHAYTISPETAHTAVLVLDSDEPEVLCMTLRAITKFSAQAMANREQLFNLNAIRYILRHIDHSELNIRRFALKALAQLLVLPRGPEQVLEDPQHLRKIAMMLTKVEDVFVLEFASLNLAELTREPLGCDLVVSCNILTTLFNRMKNSLDPDVQKNCLQVVSNLLDDPVCAAEVSKNHQFSWASILALMQNKYLAIQHAALRTVDQLICRYKDEVIQKTFRASTGVVDLCDILESYEFHDVHDKVLNVLRNYVETEENAAHAYQAGCVFTLLSYLDVALPAMKMHCLAVLTKMSFTVRGRDALFQTGTDLVFCHQLLSSNQQLLADAAMGVANMTKLLPAAVRMCELNIIEALCAILADDEAPWFYVRMNALRALAELCRIIPKAAYSLVEPTTFAALRNINKKPKESPVEAQRLAVECYINLENYNISTRAMLTKEFFREMLNTLAQIDTSLKILSSQTLFGLMKEPKAKEIFTSQGGEEVIAANLNIEHIGLRTSLCNLITASVTDQSANIYLELGSIDYMVQNRVARYVVSAWEVALYTIFSHHPSAKLAYTGRLDINDFTVDGFYVMKRLTKSFPTLKQLTEERTRFRDPVYICTFSKAPLSFISSPSAEMSRSQLLLTISNTTQVSDNLPKDLNLPKYLMKLRIWFGNPDQSLHKINLDDYEQDESNREKCQEVTISLKERANLLAQFVVEQMCGLNQERECNIESVSLYLSDLMADLQTRLIGIGWVRCGGALERAILYKVLADRMGLPCALHRATSAHAWCEVAVPETPDSYLSALREGDDSKIVDEKFPAGLLRANYVVDLMFSPGKLLKVGSSEAEKICGPTCAPRYTARQLPEVCKCEPKSVKFNESGVKFGNLSRPFVSVGDVKTRSSKNFDGSQRNL